MGTCCKVSQKSKPKPARKTTFKKTFNKKMFIRMTTSSISDNYKILKKLGNGNSSHVSLALHLATNTERAIKTIPFLDSVDTTQFINEVNVLKSLDHPNIIQIYEVIQDGNSLNIVMEYLSGGELFKRIKKNQSFSENLAANYMFDIASAIKYCHESKIVHRDLKAENILFENEKPDARLKVIDFDTSKLIRNSEKLTKIVGTDYYVAPEVIDQNYDEKCDVWSLGVILYIMLCGYPPFHGISKEETFNKIKHSPLEFKDEYWHKVSSEAKSLLEKMLTKDPKTRYSINDVYSDPWIQSRANNQLPDKPIAESALKNLLSFSSENYLQKVTMSYVVSQLVSSSEIQELKKIFNRLDKNGDGRISKEEIFSGCSEYLEKLEMDPREILDKCDLDGNGFIDYSEFLTAAIDWHKTLSVNRLREAFKLFDKDSSGKISKEELLVVFKNCGMGDEEIEELVTIIDDNGDGQIDFNEFKKLMQSNRI